jgi:hypothetical protein
MNLAVSYSVGSSSDLIDSRTQHRVLIADCQEQAAPVVAERMIEVCDRLVREGPSSAELQKDLDLLERGLRHEPRAIAGWMSYAAQCYLNGIDVSEFDEYIEARRLLTPYHVRDAWATAMETAILLVPPWVSVPDDRFGRRTWPTPVKGRAFIHRVWRVSATACAPSSRQTV